MKGTINRLNFIEGRCEVAKFKDESVLLKLVPFTCLFLEIYHYQDIAKKTVDNI